MFFCVKIVRMCERRRARIGRQTCMQAGKEEAEEAIVGLFGRKVGQETIVSSRLTHETTGDA